MNRKDNSHPHMELTEKIIGAAMTVHRALGPGLAESIYENALCIELAEQSIHFSQQERFPVSYRGHIVGTLVTDLIIEEKVIVEAKVVATILDVHIAQTLRPHPQLQTPFARIQTRSQHLPKIQSVKSV